MTINKQNGRCYVKLPKTIIDKVDKEAEKAFTSRSSRLAKIIVEHYDGRGGER
ncbi:MAG TPA: hypothetical protein VI423_03055 [Paenisporosarcina sp.]|nr:hypothetical protein [Paenisporosarcina sp.]